MFHYHITLKLGSKSFLVSNFVPLFFNNSSTSNAIAGADDNAGDCIPATLIKFLLFLPYLSFNLPLTKL